MDLPTEILVDGVRRAQWMAYNKQDAKEAAAKQAMIAMGWMIDPSAHVTPGTGNGALPDPKTASVSVGA